MWEEFLSTKTLGLALRALTYTMMHIYIYIVELELYEM